MDTSAPPVDSKYSSLMSYFWPATREMAPLSSVTPWSVQLLMICLPLIQRRTPSSLVV